MKYSKPIVVAEIGCNHQGSLDQAKKLIREASKCGADYAKFQKRDNKYLLKIQSKWEIENGGFIMI